MRIDGSQKLHKGIMTYLLAARNEWSFVWYGRGWELPLNIFMEDAFNGENATPDQITNAFMKVNFRQAIEEGAEVNVICIQSNGCQLTACGLGDWLRRHCRDQGSARSKAGWGGQYL